MDNPSHFASAWVQHQPKYRLPYSSHVVTGAAVCPRGTATDGLYLPTTNPFPSFAAGARENTFQFSLPCGVATTEVLCGCKSVECLSPRIRDPSFDQGICEPGYFIQFLSHPIHIN